MVSLTVSIIVCGIIMYLLVSTVYLLILAVAYSLCRIKVKPIVTNTNNKFIVLVPAHNEEMLISTLLNSLLVVDYPKEQYDISVVADNCDDNTVKICSKFAVNVIIRDDLTKVGKGYAIDWGIKNTNLNNYDALLVVDADNYVDIEILSELNDMLNRGERAIQCYNTVGNRNDSWFTQLLFVSRTISNLLYHQSKYLLGLSSYLMGNGICFKIDLIEQKGWTAYTLGEDWEYYAQLIKDKIQIGFAVNAKVYHQESKSLNQATSQRLRWSSGRFYVAKKLGLRIMFDGIRRRDLLMVDASFPLIFPNYSLQFNLSILCLLTVTVIKTVQFHDIMLATCIGLLVGQSGLFIYGVLLSGQYLDVIKSVCFAPLFLIWKLSIDIISFTGVYKGDKWIRTKRHVANDDK